MMRRFVSARGLLAAMLLALPATPAVAGPPLLCHPFDPGRSPVLPWAAAPSWKAPDPAYDRSRLVADVLRLLAPDAPVLARMENLRRATIYAATDRGVADALLAALLARTRTAGGGESRDPLAWFDAGYLVESYRDAFLVYEWDMLSREERGRWAIDRAPTLDGQAMVRRALALMTRPNPAMADAARLIGERRAAR